ncbi:MAG: superoxide dismutase [Candidatus Levybacteria bacterium RBG_16_35_11]|nr:MAG: superoxide dismutase [Candidatus Levybacteria bacterium RBG_16_35_11]
MYALPDLPYSYNALEPFIDEQTMHVHHDGHHATYVKNLNDVLSGHNELLNIDTKELLKSLDKVPEEIRTKVKNNAGGHFHHSFFWRIIKPNGGGEPKGRLLELISKNFKDFNSFKEKFKDSALSLFGSGWTWLIVNPDGKLEILNLPNQDSPISVDKTPVFTIDLWEHAYYLKYKNKRADFIDAFWNIVNWEQAEKNLNS